MDKWKIFVDDERIAPNGWITVFDGDSLVYLLGTHYEDKRLGTLSLDHDLGHGLDGYETIKKIARDNLKVLSCFDRIMVHSSNPVGRKNILSYLLNLQANGLISKKVLIDRHHYSYQKVWDEEAKRYYGQLIQTL